MAKTNKRKTTGTVKNEELWKALSETSNKCQTIRDLSASGACLIGASEAHNNFLKNAGYYKKLEKWVWAKKGTTLNLEGLRANPETTRKTVVVNTCKPWQKHMSKEFNACVDGVNDYLEKVRVLQANSII